MKSDISVVIPLYNKEKEIARTLRSVLAQTSQPLEIIVVDDGSTDGSAARVEEIGSPLIRLIRQENRGVSAARNRAMQEACGEYAALLDGDDTWEPGYLAEIERLIAAYPGCGAYATSFNVDDGHHLTPGDTPQTEGVVDFFYFKLIDFPVFNVADIYVTVGTFILAFLLLFYYKEEDLDRIFHS